MDQNAQSLIEVRDPNRGTVVGYRCGVCQRFYGSQEVQEAQECVESHRNLLVEG